MSAREVYDVTGGCTRKKQEMVFQKTSELLLNEFYKFVDLSACEAGLCISGAEGVVEGCAAVERFFS